MPEKWRGFLNLKIMKEYIVKAEFITGRKSKQYKKGDKITPDLLASDIEPLVKKGFIEPVSISAMPEKKAAKITS